MWTCGTQGHKRNTQTEGHVTTEAEIGAIPPQVKECQGMPGTLGNWKRQGRDIL